jgi:hypothetical protein
VLVASVANLKADQQAMLQKDLVELVSSPFVQLSLKMS